MGKPEVGNGPIRPVKRRQARFEKKMNGDILGNIFMDRNIIGAWSPPHGVPGRGHNGRKEHRRS